MLRSVTIQLPQTTFERLKRVAQQQNRTIADTVDALVMRVDQLPELPEDVERELAALPNLTNDVLLAFVRQPMPTDQQNELEQLTFNAQSGRALTESEEARQIELSETYQRAVLRRARSLEILRQRGFDLDELLHID